MLRKQREELLEDVPNEPDAAPVPDDAAVSTDNIERLTEPVSYTHLPFGNKLLLTKLFYHGQILLLRHLHRERQHDTAHQSGVCKVHANAAEQLLDNDDSHQIADRCV